MDSSPALTRGRFVAPEVVASHFHLRRGDAVADFGAGSGYFTPTLAKLVGADGRVYACEIQRMLVEKIGEVVRRENLSNVEVLWCDMGAQNGIPLPDQSLNAGVIVNTLFQLEDKPAAITEMVRTLQSGGKLFIIDWSESFDGLGPHPNDVVTETDAVALAESHGLVYERTFDAGDHHYGLAFRKS